MARKPIQFRLNGADEAIFVADGQNLLDALRQEVGDLGPKYGCGQGTCGACTVLVEGEPQLACLVLAETMEGRSIETVSGISTSTCIRSSRPSWTGSPPSAATARRAC
jgi:aerobic carbon-monoxide dehydrogenase small subunit